MPNEPAFISPVSNAAWKPAMMDLLNAQRFTHAITLAWNRHVGLERARADLRDLLHRIDRSLLGSRFHRRPACARTRAIFVMEGMGYGHVHAHSVWRSPPGELLRFSKLFMPPRGGVWNDVVTSGTCDVKFADPSVRNSEITGYILKEQHRSSDAFEMIWSDEFHPTP